MNSMHYVYILRCADDTLYTGWNSARSHDPFTLIYKAEFSSKEWAEQRVDYLKGLSDSDRELFLDNHKNHRKYKDKHFPKIETSQFLY